MRDYRLAEGKLGENLISCDFCGGKPRDQEAPRNGPGEDIFRTMDVMMYSSMYLWWLGVYKLFCLENTVIVLSNVKLIQYLESCLLKKGTHRCWVGSSSSASSLLCHLTPGQMGGGRLCCKQHTWPALVDPTTDNCPGYFSEGKVEGAKLAYDRET